MGDAERHKTADKPRSSQEFLDQLPPELRAGLLHLFEATREITRDELTEIRAGDPSERADGLESLARARHADLEDAVEEAFAAGPDGEATRRAVACRKGCSFCCHVNVSTTIPDAILVASKIQSGPAGRFASVVRSTAERIAGLDAPSRYRRGIPCPMLEDGACGIHEARPTACRAYLATDARTCEASLNAARRGQPPSPVESLAYPQQISAAINGGVLQGCGDAGLQNCAVEMTQAVALILREPTAVERWLNGEAVFTPYGRG